MKQLCLFLLLFCCTSMCYGQNNDSVSINITQPNVYVVKNEWSQQINFDFNISNKTSETINLKRLELYVYDKNGNLICFKALRDGPVAPSIGTIPIRQVQKSENVTVFNPFTVFNPYIELHRLKYVLSFKGDLYSNHRRFDINNKQVQALMDTDTNPEMFAVDFSVVDSLGEAYSGDRRNNMNYYIFGETVYAPANGKVLKINNHFEDNTPGSLAFEVQDTKTNRDLFAGNCIVIDHLNGEYSFLVHLKRGSVTVKEGDIVKKGEPIGQVGNSGSSMYAHLHYQLCDRPDYLNSNGLPIYFHNYGLISGEKRIEIGKSYISAGDVIEN